MKKIPNVFIFLFFIFFFNPVFAATLLDIDFNGIKIGDSLLSYMTKEEILNEIEYNNSIGQHYLTREFGEVYHEVIDSKNNIMHLAFYVKPNDKHFYIHFIREIKIFDNDFDSCMKYRDKVDHLLKDYYYNAEREEISFNMDFDESGRSQSHNINFLFDSGDFISITCQKYSKLYKQEYNLVDQFNFALGTKDIKMWFMNPI